MKQKTLIPLIVFLLGICLVGIILYKVDSHETAQNHTTALLNATTYGERIKNEITEGIDVTDVLKQILISEDGELFCLFWKSLLYYIYKEFVILPVFGGEFIFCFLVYWIMFVFCFLLIILFVSRKSLKTYFLSTLQRYGRNTKGLIGVYFNFQDVFFNFSNDFF